MARLGLISALSQAHPEWMLSEASTGNHTIALGQSLKPDAAIVDLELTKPTGLDVIKALSSPPARVRVLAISSFGVLPVLNKARGAGAKGFIAKTESAARIVAAVEDLIAGKSSFPSLRAQSELEKLNRDIPVPIGYLLSDRELEVLRFMADGLTTERIAIALGISVPAAEAYCADIYTRLKAKSLRQVVRMASRDGVI